jgi:hypothetical protein
VLAAPFAYESANHQAEVRRGICSVLDWLAEVPGRTWQQRWTASGAEQAADWRTLVAISAAAGRSETAVRRQQNACSYGLSVLVCADVIRPSVGWLLSTPSPRNLAAALARTRDPEGFAVLEKECRRHATGEATRTVALGRIAMIMAAKGGRTCDITVGDCLEMVQASAEAAQAAGRDRSYRSSFFYQLVRSLGRFPGNAPATTRAFHVSGQRSIEEMVGRYGIEYRPVRDLLVDYLREFEVSHDYATLRSLAFVLARVFWRDLELHHPGISSLSLSPDAAAAWKQRVLVKETTAVEDGELVVQHAPRLCAIQYLGNVRSFYLDIAQWAADDPSRWAPWVAACPIRDGELTRAAARTPPRASHGWTSAPASASPCCPPWSPPPGTAAPAPRSCSPPRPPPPRARTSPPGARPCTGPRAQGRGTTCLLGLGRRRGPAADRHPHRGTDRALAPQPHPVPASRHRRAGPAAADRPFQDR